MNNETVSDNVDLQLPYEMERKFHALVPSEFTEMMYRQDTLPIEQIYLSSPGEPFNLRLRETMHVDGNSVYEATLKDRGTVQPEGIKRLEVNTLITPELYSFYKSERTPVLKKLRAEPVPDVIVDFYEDGTVQIESESEKQLDIFKTIYGDTFLEVTGSVEGDNEYRAHESRLTAGGGDETGDQDPDIEVATIISDILSAKNSSGKPIVVHVGGRSGSGKSTVVRDLVQELETFGITSSTLSTDDYHRGESWLRRHNSGQPWQKWDDEIVYDLATMARDMEMLRSGQPINKRTIDWKTVEPIIVSLLQPTEIIIIEGIYATSHEITAEDDLKYILNTPLATCIGRRLLRDIKERPQFADPASSLNYMLSEAEPAYRRQSKL